MKTLPDRIRIEYRLRIETETAGLNAQEAAVLTRKLEDEKEMHLNDTAGYVGLLQSSSLLLCTHHPTLYVTDQRIWQLSLKRGSPSILKLVRDLLVFDLACSDEHAVFLTRDGQVYTWGFGGSGKLGHGGLSDEPLPQIVDTLSKRRCIQVRAGSRSGQSGRLEGVSFSVCFISTDASRDSALSPRELMLVC